MGAMVDPRHQQRGKISEMVAAAVAAMGPSRREKDGTMEEDDEEEGEISKCRPILRRRRLKAIAWRVKS